MSQTDVVSKNGVAGVGGHNSKIDHSVDRAVNWLLHSGIQVESDLPETNGGFAS